MTGQDPEGVEDTVADLDDLRLELAEASGDWTMPVVVRSYGPGEDYDEDYEDEAMVFREEHGYDVSVVRGEGSLTATYRKAVAATIVRTYSGHQQADALAAFVGQGRCCRLDASRRRGRVGQNTRSGPQRPSGDDLLDARHVTVDLPTGDTQTKVCPQCAEEVKAAALRLPAFL